MAAKQHDDEGNLVRNIALTLARTNDEKVTGEIVGRQYGIAGNRMKREIQKARKYLLSFSHFDPYEEFGKSLLQFDEVYRLAVDTSNAAAALSAVREMASLRNLYALTNCKSTELEQQTRTEVLIRQHLEGLAITAEGLPIEELARQVALYVINKIKNGETEQI